MTATTPELLCIPYSPWSEKARWALDVRGVPYRTRYYQPLLGEPELRWRTKRWTGRVSVPVMFTTGGVLTDSLDIARFAARDGHGPDLFPSGQDAAIERWNAASERALAAGRALSLERVLKDPAALGELVPRGVRNTLGRLVTPLAAMGVRRTLRKYGAHKAGDHAATFVAVLDELRAALAAAGGDALLGPAHGFSYADISMAQVIAYVRPPATGLRLGRANRVAYGDEALAERYADLVAWRDRLYAKFRQVPGK